MRRWSIGLLRPQLRTRCCTTRLVRGAMADAQVNVRASADVAARVGRALGIALPIEPNTVATVGECSILLLGPDDLLVVDSKGSAPHIETHRHPALPPPFGFTLDRFGNPTNIDL